MKPALPPTAQRVLQAFAAQHGQPARVLARAPGRVNLIGEHTDYNDGFVLPVAIDRDTWVAAGVRADNEVHATALDWQGETDQFGLAAQPLAADGGALPHDRDSGEWPARAEGGGWRNHVRGTLAQLHAAVPLPSGLNLVMAGDVPQGAGLSSSASLALALLRAAEAAHALPGLSEARLARLAQRAENVFVCCQCGIMDQLCSASGIAGHALLIDCRSLQVQPVPLPVGTALLIVHSRVRRGLVDSAYNERRLQCEAAAAALGVPALRDARLAQLQAAQSGPAPLPDAVFRRARHIVTENQRVLDAAAALRASDVRTLGTLMAASHASMRDDFEITVPAVDHLAALLHEVAGDEGGARMTGGGFGGCVVALLPQHRLAQAAAVVAAQYRSPEGERAELYTCIAAQGAAAWAL